MPHYNYLIIGGGMTGDSAIHGIREVDPSGAIGLIGAETDPPYDRPPLSKGLWKGLPLEKLWRGPQPQGVALHLGRSVRMLDPRSKSVTDDKGGSYTYDKLLLATGATPRRLPYGGDDIIYYRTVQDYHRLRALVDQKKSVAVIGGGFIGSEVAAALAMNGIKTAMIFPEETIGARPYPKGLAQFLNGFYRQKGVDVLPETRIDGMEKRGNRLVLKTTGLKTAHEQEIIVDGIVAGIGVLPNIELAKMAGLKVDNGIVVDAFLRTSQPDIYAAGDVADFSNPALGKLLRVEHEDNANTMGKMAGRIMAGAAEAYQHLPFFYSDLFELGYEAVGDLDARLEIVEDWKVPNRDGVVYYLQEGRVRGVLLWNVWDQVPNARRLIAEAGPFRPADLKGRLPAGG